MKQLEVQILGQSYLLGCPEGGESRLLDAVERVDTAMCRIRDAGKVRARERIAVLAALNLAFELPDRSSSPAVAEGGGAGLTNASPPPPTGVGGQPTTKPGEDMLLTSLLSRLDNALSDDGRLI